VDDVDDHLALVVDIIGLTLGGVGTNVWAKSNVSLLRPLQRDPLARRDPEYDIPMFSPPTLIFLQSASYATPSTSLTSYESEMISSSVIKSCGEFQSVSVGAIPGSEE
jgi:hypothetical protein